MLLNQQIQLSLRMLWRDFRSGELRILAFALIIAVGSVTAVGFFIDRVQQGMESQAAELIAADLVVASPHPLPDNYRQAALTRGLQVVDTVNFRSVILVGEKLQLVEVKAVGNGYPLRGQLRVAPTAFASEAISESIPAAGESWVEARLLQLLHIEPGATVSLGQRMLTINKVLTYEPDRGGDFFSVAPRLLINIDDVAATGLIQTGALVSYRLLIAGKRSDTVDYQGWLTTRIQTGEQLLTVNEGRPELRTALQRAQDFLALASMISVLLAGVAIATSARRFAQRHLDATAMLRCFGAAQRTVISLFGLEMLWLALLASTVGAVLGVLMQVVISQIMDQLFLTNLPLPTLKPLLLGYASGVMLLLGFAMPPLLGLRQVPPLRVLRRDLVGRGVATWQMYLTVVISMGLLLYWQIGQLRMVLFVIGGMMFAVALLTLAAYVLVRVINRLRQSVGVAWRFGLANIARRPGGSVIQIVSFGIGIMVLLLLSTVRTDLLEGWRRSLPNDAPNHFLINVQPDQVDAIQQFFKNEGMAQPLLHPMVRARLVSINDRAVNATDYQDEQAKHLVTREFNLSWSAQPQAGNTIDAGQWWKTTEHGQPLLSLESKLAQTIGVKLHDRVGFDVNGSIVQLKITNLRTVDWDSFKVNFFTVSPPGVLEQYPSSWVTSLYLTAEEKHRLSGLIKQFPNVTIIDIEAIMNRVRAIMDRLALAVEFLFLFTLLAGLAVLYAAIAANLDERRFESAILRTLGARRYLLRRGLIAEFVTLGALAGMLAGTTATALAWVLATQVFHFPYIPQPWITLVGTLVGAVGIGAAGLLGTRQVLQQPPMQTLKRT